jgi:hypothetical protein
MNLNQSRAEIMYMSQDYQELQTSIKGLVARLKVCSDAESRNELEEFIASLKTRKCIDWSRPKLPSSWVDRLLDVLHLPTRHRPSLEDL